jgi:hypothetical protein
MTSVEEREIEDSTDSISISERSKKNKVRVDLIEYSVISKFFEDENENSQLIYLPTPESIEELINSKLVQDFISYDINKYKSLFGKVEEENEEDEDLSSEEKYCLDLNKIISIQDITMLSVVLVFLGGINSQNDIYTIFPNETPQNPDEECYIDKAPNYLYYAYNCVEYLRHQQISFPFSDLNLLFKSLEDIGFHISINNKNILYRCIKDSFMSLLDNKILVVLAPSNNFWVKSEKTIINGVNYDTKLNNYCNIFYNKRLIKKFLTKICKHPRSNLCLMSSMTLKNLKAAIDGLDVQFNDYLPKKYAIISQNDHDIINPSNSKDMPLFFRNMEKIIQNLKQVEKWDYFDEKNIIILEGDKNKISESTESNTILSCLFSEEYLESENKKKYNIEKEADKIINYVINLLENCPNDVRDYISHNPINNDNCDDNHKVNEDNNNNEKH